MNANLIEYVLHLADSALIQSQRISEWTGHGPALEQDIALTNIALDNIGQARNFYQYAAELKADGCNEDTLAFLRTEDAYHNHLLVELPNGDWGQTVLKLFFFSTYQKLLYEQLHQCTDERIAAIAEKSLKEINYHVRWSSEWVVRLGDGTEESHQRMLTALDNLWMYVSALFEKPSYDMGWVDYELLQQSWMDKVTGVFDEAHLDLPTIASFQKGGHDGIHTEHLGYILAEMQYLQRVYPGNEW
jgi:ring-1,2-phenylacetyl-CoA epoxidase subunit PaaC